MRRRWWITAFLLSFMPLGGWMLFWFFFFIGSGGGWDGLELAFIIPAILWVGFQTWLAFRAFMVQIKVWFVNLGEYT